MANHLKMAKAQAIQALREQGWSYRRIARMLRISRVTVKRHIELGRARAAPPTGSDVQTGPNPPAGYSGPISRCDPFRDTIIAALERGLSYQRIWQDLRDDGFAGGYDAVKRYARRLARVNQLPVRRMECEPGAEAQVDFRTGAPVVIPEGEPLSIGAKTRRRRTHIFRIVLSHSRKAYSELVYRQTTEDFIRCLEDAFWHFGGVPRTLVIDNLKAAVRFGSAQPAPRISNRVLSRSSRSHLRPQARGTRCPGTTAGQSRRPAPTHLTDSSPVGFAASTPIKTANAHHKDTQAESAITLPAAGWLAAC